MIRYPEYNNSYIVNLVAIDPGSTKLGFAVLSVDVRSNTIVQSIAKTYITDKMVPEDDMLVKTHGERCDRILAQSNNLYSEFMYHHPSVIAYESPFYNPRTPMAYGALMQVLMAIKASAIKYNPLINFVQFAPREIKKCICVDDKGVDKDTIRRHVLARNDLNYVGDVPLHKLGPDAIDALAIGLTMVANLDNRW